jgi:Mg2+-importing ATPase
VSAPAEPDAPRLGRARWARWLGWAVLLALVIGAARAVEWRPALAATLRADPLWLLAALGLNALLLPCATVQWRLLLPDDARLATRELFGIVALTSSVANGAPMLAGQAAGVHLLATRGRLGHARAVAVTVLEQLTEGMAKLALLAVAAIVVPVFEPALGVAVLIAVPALTAALTLAAHRRAWMDRLAARARGAAAKAVGFLALALAHLDALRRPRRFAGAVAVGAVKKAVEGLAIAAVAAALAVPLPAWAVVAAVAAVNLSQLVAVTPANLGPYEGGAFFVYRAAGVAPDAALALALVQHAVYLVPLAGIGWILESARLLKRTTRA